MERVSVRDSERIRALSDKLGDRTLRTLLTPEGKRILRPDRLENLQSGRGKLSESERARLSLIADNQQSLSALKNRGTGKREFKVNRAMRDWLHNGKQKGVTYADQDSDVKADQLKAIRALRFLGVDPQDGTFYVRRRR